MKKNILLLSACQALWMSGMSLMIATSALVGMSLAPLPTLATVPLALLFFSGMLTSFPASMLMKHTGRRGGFLIGIGFGIIGAGLSGISIFAGNFAGFCLGSLLIGMMNGFAQYYRFAAADVATVDFKSRAISYVLAGGVVAAFIGPNLANLSKDLIPNALFAGGYFSVVGLHILSFLVMWFVSIPNPSDEEMRGAQRPLAEIIKQPVFLVAALCGAVAYGTMNILMTATPLAMQDHHHAFADTAMVIQWHVLGMYVPSFFTGHIIHRFGVTKVMAAGGLILFACVGVSLSGMGFYNFWFALLLLGIGWNFMFIGATNLVTEAYRPAEKAKVQGANDLIVFSTVAATALLSGFLHHAIGWQAMNYAVLPVITLAVVSAVWLTLRRTQHLDGVLK